MYKTLEIGSDEAPTSDVIRSHSGVTLLRSCEILAAIRSAIEVLPVPVVPVSKSGFASGSIFANDSLTKADNRFSGPAIK
jgi:hypothetical protein